jgi:hypothetical protein
MKRNILAIAAGLALTFSGSLTAGDIAMQIAPSVLNLEAALYKLTIHADVELNSVVESDLVLVLQGVGILPIDSLRDDYEGNLVADFTWDTGALSPDAKAKLLDAGEADFQLSGRTFADELFEGEDEVLVLGKGGR